MKLLPQLKALADETRLRIFNLLLKHELNVNEIVTVLGMGQSRVSRHLKILSDSGLVSFRRDGLWVFYRADVDNYPAGEYRRLIDKDQNLVEDITRLEERLLEKAREKTLFYDSIAPEWDSLKSGIIGEVHVQDEILARLNPCGVAADLGCGTGELLPFLGGKAGRVIGVDRSPRMLEEARERLRGNGRNIELRIGELEHLPMRDGEADTAVINMVLHHLSAPPEGIRESARVLKPGDRLIITDLDKHEREEMRGKYGHRWLGFTAGEMESWLEEAGFTVAEAARFNTGKELTVMLYAASKR